MGFVSEAPNSVQRVSLTAFAIDWSVCALRASDEDPGRGNVAAVTVTLASEPSQCSCFLAAFSSAD